MRLDALIAVISALHAPDALPGPLGADDWREISPYLTQHFLRPGETLIHMGDVDRQLYFLAEGELQVCIGQQVLAQIGPGAVVGEGGFFSGAPRSASVRSTQAGVAWGLSWERFERMGKRHPRVALELSKGLAAVLAVRMREAILVGHFT